MFSAYHTDRDGRFYDDYAALAGRFVNVGASVSGIFERARQGRFLNKHAAPSEARLPLSVNFKTIPGKPDPIVISKLILPCDFFASGKAPSLAALEPSNEKSPSVSTANNLLDISLKA